MQTSGPSDEMLMKAITCLQAKTILSPQIGITVNGSNNVFFEALSCIRRCLSLTQGIQGDFIPIVSLGCDCKATQITLDRRSHDCPPDPCSHFLNMAMNVRATFVASGGGITRKIALPPVNRSAIGAVCRGQRLRHGDNFIGWCERPN